MPTQDTIGIHDETESMFDCFVLCFDDGDALSDWATEYGHMNERVVLEHLIQLRDYRETTMEVSILVCIINYIA